MRYLLFLTSLLAVSFVINAQTLFIEKHLEDQLPPYSSRTLISDDYLRMDDGDNAGDFVLLNIPKKIISSVTHSDGSVFEVTYKKVTHPQPVKLKREVVKQPADDYPMLFGVKPQRVSLNVNGRECLQMTVLPDTQAKAIAALKLYYGILAGEQSQILAVTPADQIDECDLALNIYYPHWRFEYGLPIEQTFWTRKTQLLADIIEPKMDLSKLFQLPENYLRYSTGSQR